MAYIFIMESMMEMTMPERIRFAQGTSSLGGIFAAISERGLVNFSFVKETDTALDALRPRLPDADFEEDQAGLADLMRRLAAVVDNPVEEPEIALDPRGNDYEKVVWSLLQEIPAGQTTTYGALAARLGSRDARDVTAAIAANDIAILIPCHRVVRTDGTVSGYRWGGWRKRALLDRERQAAPFLVA